LFFERWQILEIMIKQNKKYGNIKNVTIVEFGSGTTRIVNANGEGYKALLLGSQKEPKKIGEIGEKFPTSDEFNPEVVITFWNEESFTVFEDFVKNIREEFDGEKEALVEK
jgi:hypothetical protein